MKERKKKIKKERSRRSLLIAGAIVGVIVVASAISLAARRRAAETESTPKITDVTKKYVSVRVAGRDVEFDPQTGQIKPMTPEKAQEIAELLKARLSKSADGLVQVRNADGSISMDLQGRAQNVVLARSNDDGTVEHTCVDEPLAAAEFLGIDPKLVGADVPQRPNGQSTVPSPPKKSIQ